MQSKSQQPVKRYVAKFHEYPRKVPTNVVVDGPIIGNGDIGVTLGGPPEAQRFWISKSDFWKAQHGHHNGRICVFGWIDVKIEGLSRASYYVEQGLCEAETRATFKKDVITVTLRSWVAATDNLLVVEFATEGGDVQVDVTLSPKTGSESKIAGGPIDDGYWATRKFDGNDLDWPTEGAVATRLLFHEKAPLPRWVMQGPCERFNLVPGKAVILVAAMYTNHDTARPLTKVRNCVEKMTFEKIESLRRAHQKWWRSFWEKSFIEIDDPVIERFWYAANYIMASCSRNKKFPPGLYGSWVTTDHAGWCGDYHLNYNYQAPWWGVYSSNHVELAEPYDTPIIEYMSKARENAKKLLNCRGLYYEVGIGPKALGTAETLFWNQKSNASFAAVNMVMRFYHTYDLEYAKKVAYPFMVEVADFWEDYLKFENGRYVDYDDNVHESCNSELYDENSPEDVNPLLSLGFIRMLFKALLDMSAELGVDADRRKKWRHILDNISEFPTMQRNGKKVFRYTEKGLEWSVGNAVGLQHIWPAGTIGLDSDDELLQTARNMVAAKARWEDSNAFPTFYTAAVRVGYDPEEILRNLREQLEKNSFANLHVYYWGGGIETCGTTAAVNEMLLQSHEGVLIFFPVWPKERNARFGNLRAVGAFLVSGELRNGRVRYVEIESEKGRDCTIQNPWPGQRLAVYKIKQKAHQPGVPQRQPRSVWGDTVDICETKKNRFSFATDAGSRYKIEPSR